MLWFGKRKQDAINASKEAEFRRIHNQNIQRNYRAAEEIDKTTKLLEDRDMGITELIFLATGGDHRGKR